LIWHVGHFGGFGGYADGLDIGNHVAGADNDDGGADADAMILDEFAIEPGGVFDGDAAQSDGFETDSRFQVSVFTGGPDDVDDFGLGHLVGNHHFERECVVRIAGFSVIYCIICNNDTVDVVFVMGAPVE